MTLTFILEEKDGQTVRRINNKIGKDLSALVRMGDTSPGHKVYTGLWERYVCGFETHETISRERSSLIIDVWNWVTNDSKVQELEEYKELTKLLESDPMEFVVKWDLNRFNLANANSILRKAKRSYKAQSSDYKKKVSEREHGIKYLQKKCPNHYLKLKMYDLT